MKAIFFSLLFFPLAGSAVVAHAETSADAVAPDNTKKNERDRGDKTMTPGDQGENKADLAITKAIRQQVMKQHVSALAKNVKIITADSVVTLRGPVKSDAEKATIGKVAEGVAGVKQVDNQLEIAAK